MSKKDNGYTRAQAERMISRGEVSPDFFLDLENPFRMSSTNKAGQQEQTSRNHINAHVRRKAWVKMGRPVLPDPADHAKFLASIGVKEKTEMVEEPTNINKEGTDQ